MEGCRKKWGTLSQWKKQLHQGGEIPSKTESTPSFFFPSWLIATRKYKHSLCLWAEVIMPFNQLLFLVGHFLPVPNRSYTLLLSLSRRLLLQFFLKKMKHFISCVADRAPHAIIYKMAKSLNSILSILHLVWAKYTFWWNSFLTARMLINTLYNKFCLCVYCNRHYALHNSIRVWKKYDSLVL